MKRINFIDGLAYRLYPAVFMLVDVGTHVAAVVTSIVPSQSTVLRLRMRNFAALPRIYVPTKCRMCIHQREIPNLQQVQVDSLSTANISLN
jgi:hypothetical protein